jgi:pimeloyl-ACP methyl ester carboxylesterase
MKGYGETKKVTKFEISQDLDFVADALAALSYLAKLSIINEEKLSIVGHSSGGNIAFAAGAKDPRVKNIAPLSPGDFDPLRHSSSLKKHYRNRLAKGLKYKMSMEYYDEVVTPLTMFSYLPLDSSKRVLFTTAELESRNQINFAERLFEEISIPKKYVMIKGIDHCYGARLVDGDKILNPAKLEELVEVIDIWLKEEKEI